MTKAYVTEILFEGQRAAGVSYQKGSSRFTALAKSEVILSCGALNSPQLLMLSGLGPAQELKSHGLRVRRDMPDVGAHL